MKISIITVNLNNCAGLDRTLASVAAQTHTDYEPTLLDRAAAHGSAECARSWHERNPRVTHCISEKDGGIYQAMNKGAALARGEYVLFLNSGDSLLPEALALIEPELDGTHMVYGDLMVERPDGSRYKESLMTPPFGREHLTLPHFYLPHPATFIKRCVLGPHPYDESLRIIADWEFWVRYILSGGSSIRRVDLPVSVLARGGVSANIEAENREKEVVFRRYALGRKYWHLRLLRKLLNKS